MPTRVELEEALAASFDAAHLAAYGDLLRSEGDPRGELIAIDLAAPAPPDAQARRARLLLQTVGAALVRERGYQVRGGFLELVVRPPASERCVHILETPIGPYLRTIHLSGPDRLLKRCIGMLAQETRRWLATLSIHLDNSYAAGVKTPVISKRMTAQLFAATPRLQRIEVTSFNLPAANSRPIFPPGLAHPRAGEPRVGRLR